MLELQVAFIKVLVGRQMHVDVIKRIRWQEPLLLLLIRTVQHLVHDFRRHRLTHCHVSNSHNKRIVAMELLMHQVVTSLELWRWLLNAPHLSWKADRFDLGLEVHFRLLVRLLNLLFSEKFLQATGNDWKEKLN